MKNKMIMVFTLLVITVTEVCIGQNPLTVAGTATNTATQSGNWSSPATWGGSPPSTNAKILIPNGITVTVDTQIATEFKSILIQGGTLRFANNVNTELRVEYIASNMTGSLEIGKATNPIANDVTANLVFDDRGETTTTQDPERFAPGMVLMGPVTMRRQQKTTWETLQINPTAGSTSLTLDTAPTT